MCMSDVSSRVIDGRGKHFSFLQTNPIMSAIFNHAISSRNSLTYCNARDMVEQPQPSLDPCIVVMSQRYVNTRGGQPSKLLSWQIIMSCFKLVD
ncbi:hypothetical protein CDAR_190531 [Caerostris darwini]|uniref:Uncharacterized protein n=1 Tax=Caerostris darwini TaxID=1538125 RepID=A0AAV4N2Q2_9ARAC|nr:hypothetical protein CDAR_190531 [Caerostris darwini]